MKQGGVINVKGLGDRKIRKARKPFKCCGWSKPGRHEVPSGGLYVETEIAPDIAGGFGFYRSCLECI